MEQSKKTYKIKENKCLYVASILMLLYSLLEIADSIAIILIAFNIIPNLYLEWGIPVIQTFISRTPFLGFYDDENCFRNWAYEKFIMGFLDWNK